MRKLHVLMVSEFFPPQSQGGGETSAFALAKALVKNGLEVSVLTSRVDGLAERSVTDGVTIFQVLGTGKSSNSFAGNLKRLGITYSIKKELPRLVDALKPDVLHALNITSMPGVAAVAREKGIPAVAHINSPLAFDPKGTLLDGNKERTSPYSFWSFVSSYVRSESAGRLANPWYLRYNPLAWLVFYRRWVQIRDSFPLFTHFFPISLTMQRWLEVYGVPKSKTTVLPNIVLIASPTQRKTNKVPVLFYDGGYARFKGLHVLLDALRGITVPYVLNCFGAGPDRGALEQQAKVTGVRAVFHDFISENEHAKEIAQSDIIMFPSLVPEGLGRAALAAMGAGKPVIASRMGGLAETVVDGKTGVLVAPGNVPDWSHALKRLLSDEKRRRALGAAGKKRYVQMYSPKIILAKIITAYRQVLA